MNPPPPTPSLPKVWESVGQEAIHSWGQDDTYLSQMGPFPATHVPPPQRSVVEGSTVRSSTCAKIEVDGTIFDFGFSKKFDISLTPT
jgi:hypothetical protein